MVHHMNGQSVDPLQTSCSNICTQKHGCNADALFPDQCSLHIKQQKITSDFRKYKGECDISSNNVTLESQRYQSKIKNKVNMLHKALVTGSWTTGSPRHGRLLYSNEFVRLYKRLFIHYIKSIALNMYVETND